MDIQFTQPMTAASREAVLASSKVSRWLQAIQNAFDVDRVTFDAVYFFGSKVGYVMARAEAMLDGKPVPGLTLIRGSSVAVKLDLLDPGDVRHTVIVEQARLPIGEPMQIPAGMIDDGVFKSKAIDEINEEIGADIKVKEGDLTPLAMVYPSPGGCDEGICIFHAEKRVSHKAIRRLEGRETGAVNENESIRVHVILNNELPVRAATDGKSMLAYYTHMAHMGLVARPAPVPDNPDDEIPQHEASTPAIGHR